MTETIPQMRERHKAEIRIAVERMEQERKAAAARYNAAVERQKAEIRAAVECLAQERITQSEAARRNGMALTHLNKLIHRMGIYWPVIRQGYRT